MGPRKHLTILERDYPKIEVRVTSAIGDILVAQRLVGKRRR